MDKYKTSFKQNDLTFENFITGPENIIAYNAAKIFSDCAVRNNPLFIIYGGPGIGKSHLDNAILNEMIHNNPDIDYISVSGDYFINEFISFLGDGKLVSFKKKYRETDLLILEGLEFFQNKEETPYELIHIINHLIENGKCIVLTCGQNPFTLNLNTGFMRLFQQAQIVKIIKPGIDARRTFVQRQCLLNKIELNDVMISYIAKIIKSSFRAIDNYLAILFYLKDTIDEPLSLKHIKKMIKPYRD